MLKFQGNSSNFFQVSDFLRIFKVYILKSSFHSYFRVNLLSDQSAGGPTTASATFKIDFTDLYKTLCTTLKDDQTTLLLYLLIHRNVQMKAFILSRTNIDSLVSTLLQT